MASPILSLPDELLKIIISIACSISDTGRRPKCNNPTFTASVLCRVNRCFNNIATPHLYAHLCVDYRHRYYAVRGLVKDPQLLHRLITQRPLLLPLCRRLSIRCTEDRTIYGDTVPYAGDCTAFFDFARYFTKANGGSVASPPGGAVQLFQIE
ncbi:hypothetical protein BDV19DRAFT_168768 [Aspergillus venezuelensis]